MGASAVASCDKVDWTAAAKQYDNVGEMPSFVAQLRQCADMWSATSIKVDSSKLQGKQLESFDLVNKHFSCQNQQQPLKVIVSGTAGTGKSYACMSCWERNFVLWLLLELQLTMFMATHCTPC